MDNLVKAVAIAVVCFFVVLGLAIGSKASAETAALLGGTAIGLLIATPCAAIVTYLALMNRREFDERPAPPSNPLGDDRIDPKRPSLGTTHNHYTTNNVFVVHIPADEPPGMWHLYVAKQLRVNPAQAKALLAMGSVQVTQ